MRTVLELLFMMKDLIEILLAELTKSNKSLDINSNKENIFLYKGAMKFISDEYKDEEKFQNNKIVTESSTDQDELKVISKQRPSSLSSKLYQTRLQLKAYMNDDESKNEEKDYSRQIFAGKHDAKHLVTSHTFGEIQK